MIKAEELRIGNWVKYPYKVYQIGSDATHCNIKVKSIEADRVGYPYWSLDSLEPIELTPEILDKAGFEKDLSIMDAGGFYSLCFERRDNKLLLIGDEQEPIKEIKYLHQLQNLYFFLMEKELEINL